MSNIPEVSLLDQIIQSPDGLHAHAVECAIVRVTNQIEELMERKDISRSELAAMLGRSRGWVTQLLDGERNKTIRTVAYVFSVLGAQFETNYRFRREKQAGPRAEITFSVALPGAGWSQSIWTEQQIQSEPEIETRIYQRAIDAA